MKQSEVTPALERLRQRIDSAKRDDSIAALFLQRAQALAEAGGDNQLQAQIIIDQVIAAYFSATKPSSSKVGRKVASTTVTLVRWPYT